MKKSALILLSGGLDSAVCAAIARNKGFELYFLSFDYGQRHRLELQCAKKLATFFGAKKHLILKMDLGKIGGSALTADIPVPEKKNSKNKSSGIPVTYVPARNTIFLSYALAWAEVLKINDIFIGVNALDYSGYPDCRPEYIRAFRKMADLATRAGVEGGERLKINTPLIKMTKSQIIKTGQRLGLDFKLTRSCYNPDGKGNPCGKCESCFLREKGFREAGIKDPVLL